jgi:hypothetical protein
MFRAIRTRVAVAAAAFAIVATGAAPVATTLAAPIPAEPLYSTPKPDLAVEVSSMAYDADNDGMLVTLYVRNIGAADSGAYTVKGECSNMGGQHALYYNTSVTSGVKAGRDDLLRFFCPAVSWGTRVTVTTQNDSNTENNIGKSVNFW